MEEKKVLLTAINAKYIHSNLAVYSLKANAGEYEKSIEICEYTINHRREDILSRLYEKKPEIIGFSCYLWNIEYVLDIAENSKKVLPGVVIIAGGPEVSYRPEQILEQNTCFDVIMAGEGERTFREYLECVIGGRGCLAEIDGLIFREAGRIIRTKPRQGLNMDELVFPYRDLSVADNRILYYESIRGCPFSCSYCLSSVEKTVRIKSLEKTLRELDFFLSSRVPQVKFVDRTFNCNHEHAYRIWKYIGEHDNGVTNFHFEIGGDLLREEDFELFKTFRPGLVQFEIGVQSTNPETLRAIRRTMELPVLCDNIERIHEGHNIHEHLDLIVGLPFEDYGSFRKSFNDVYAMKPNQLQLGFLKVLDGSYMNEVKEQYHIVYSSQPPYEVLSTAWLSYEDILQLKRIEEMVEVYYNSFQFAATMAYLQRYFESPFDMYREMGEYYKRNGFFEKKHSRLSRYEILWDFAACLPGLQKEELRETMTYDLFSRDYVKNPPVFVRERTEDMKKKIRRFFDRECRQRNMIRGYEGMVTKQLYHMLYIDCFTINMAILIESGNVQKGEPFYLMFDYKRRNPLDHAAEAVYITKEIEMGENGE